MIDKEVKQTVINIFNDVDELMNDNGFNRRKNGLVYSRTIDKVEQKIELIFFSHPLGQMDAIAQIYPWLSVYYPEVNDLATRILGENILLDSLKDLTLRQPILIHTDSDDKWFLFNKSNEKDLSLKISYFFKANTIPFLNSLTDVNSYLKLYETQDKRLLMDDRQHLYFACAYALKGDYQAGYDLLAKRFGKTSRRIYTNLFKYFEQHL